MNMDYCIKYIKNLYNKCEEKKTLHRQELDEVNLKIATINEKYSLLLEKYIVLQEKATKEA